MRPVNAGRFAVLGGQESLQRPIDEGTPLGQIGGEVEIAHGSSSGPQVNGAEETAPDSSRASTSIRRSASSR